MRRPPTARPTAPVRQGTSALFRDRGAVTAETAVVLPGLALLLGVALCCVHAAAAHVACVDAARVGARALARGDDEAVVRSLVAQAGPPEATAELSMAEGFARVEVTAPVRIIPGLPPTVRVSGTAAIPAEPEVDALAVRSADAPSSP